MKPEISQRDPTIDFIRGAGILMIAVDHLTWLAGKLATHDFVNPFPTWMRFGWSSAAEFFVFFSGYVVGIAYLKTLGSHGHAMLWARAAQRSWHIYALNVLSLLAVFALLKVPQLFDADLAAVTKMDVLLGNQAAQGFAGVLTLRFEPLYFEILNLYVVLLILAPAIVLLCRWNVVAALAVSSAVWLAVQWSRSAGADSLLLPAGNFNPFGWQLLFVLGMACSIHDVFGRMRAKWTRKQLFLVSGALLTFAFLIKAADRAELALPLIGSFDMPGYDKVNLGPLQLVHFLVSVVFVLQIVPRSPQAQRSWPVLSVATVGRRSLECFCLSNILVYAAVALLAGGGQFGPIRLLAAGAIIVFALCLLAPAVEWLDSRPWRSRPRPLAPSEPVAGANYEEIPMRKVP